MQNMYFTIRLIRPDQAHKEAVGHQSYLTQAPDRKGPSAFLLNLTRIITSKNVWIVDLLFLIFHRY
jgi:hypothetical protein